MSSGFVGLEAYTAKVDELSDKELRKVVLAAFGAVITRSPVDEGRFRLNWKGSVGSPDISTDDVTQSATTSAPPSGAELDNIAPAMRGKIGQDVYISNNLPYAGALENGHSQQAPGGVLYPSVQEVASRLGR